MNTESTEEPKSSTAIPWEQANQADAVEKLFITPFHQLPVHPISEEDMKVHIHLLSFEKMDTPDAEQKVHSDSMRELFIYRVINKRMATMGLKLSPCLIFILALISENPGTAVMYLAVLRAWATKNSTNSVNLTQWCESVMPDGYPSEEDLKKLWYSIKVNTDFFMGQSNLLDIGKAYKSIMPAEKYDQQN